mmetsp:Transcript_36244/g.58572  ORF Transcript_36244/g.58572 Transcript_36244/m.58572 type:complete len:214 (+) Transcript_36244:650-1291(+)
MAVTNICRELSRLIVRQLGHSRKAIHFSTLGPLTHCNEGKLFDVVTSTQVDETACEDLLLLRAGEVLCKRLLCPRRTFILGSHKRVQQRLILRPCGADHNLCASGRRESLCVFMGIGAEGRARDGGEGRVFGMQDNTRIQGEDFVGGHKQRVDVDLFDEGLFDDELAELDHDALHLVYINRLSSTHPLEHMRNLGRLNHLSSEGRVEGRQAEG